MKKFCLALLLLLTLTGCVGEQDVVCTRYGRIVGEVTVDEDYSLLSLSKDYDAENDKYIVVLRFTKQD